MHQGERLRYLIDRSGKTREQIAVEAGISPASIYNYFKMDDIPRKKLLIILAAAGIESSDFWTSHVDDPAEEYVRLKEKVKTLEQMIHDKEVIIVRQQEIIELLKHQHLKKK